MEEADKHVSQTLDGHVRAVQAAGSLKYRKHKKKAHQRKISKFERRYTALGPLLKPDYKRIDYVLVHTREKSDEVQSKKKKESLEKNEKLRKRFEEALKRTGFSIKEVAIEDKVFKKLHCPFKRLCEEAERVKLEMPLSGCEKYPPTRTTWITEFFENHFETDNELDYISAPFKMNKIEMFEHYDNPTEFFRPSLRSLLTHHILINIDIRESKETEAQDGSILGGGTATLKAVEGFINDFCFCCSCLWPSLDEDKDDKLIQKIGLPYLLMKEVYEDAFILHEDSNLSEENEERDKQNDPKKTDKKQTKDLIEDPRKEMNETWCTWWKFQPMWKIRNYFGEKIGMYFAWAGMLLTSLWLPMLFGLACFIYGLNVSISRSNQDIQMPRNLTAAEEFRWQLRQLYENVRGAFDNDITPWFALVICLWGTIFLEFWKRQDANLAYEWDVDNYEANEPDRPEFFGTKVKQDPVTREDNWFYPFKRQLIKFFLSASALIFMVSIVLISVAAVVVYRVIVSVDYCGNMTTVQCLVSTTIISALLNAASILLLGRVYDWIAVKLTDWENHRTQTQYDDALIIKLFAFQFANSYASCFYIAFFRGRFDAFGVFGLGPEYSDACDGGSCMSQLSFQVLVLMVAKPFPKFFKDIILPFIKRLWRNRPECCRSNCCRNKVEDEEKLAKEPDTFSLKHGNEFIYCNYLKPKLEDFTLGEYTEKVIMYGFLMLFAASFPLAPLIAMLWLAVDIRIDAKRLLWLNRRPVAFIAQDIGMWYGILNLVNLIGVVSNGFLIAFTSQWGLKYNIITRLWICIGFEHIVFAIKLMLAYIIPDVPKDVRLAIRREKYQVFRKMEDKGHIKDYTELVPQTTYNLKVHENSGNYSAFDDPVVDQELSDLLEETPKHEPSDYELQPVREEEETQETQTGQEKTDLWYDVGTEIEYIPEVSYAASHGTASLRGIDPEGSHLFQSSPPPFETSTSADKARPKQKPSFVVNREDSTVRDGVIPPFPPNPMVPLLREETEESLNIFDESVETGPRLDDKHPEEMKVRELKKWLKLRGASRKGSKEDLVERVKWYKKEGWVKEYPTQLANNNQDKGKMTVDSDWRNVDPYAVVRADEVGKKTALRTLSEDETQC